MMTIMMMQGDDINHHRGDEGQRYNVHDYEPQEIHERDTYNARNNGLPTWRGRRRLSVQPLPH